MTSRSRILLQLLVLVLAGSCSLAGQSRRPADLGVGKILVSPRGSRDPLFARSVILLVRYNGTGALGLMLNRRTKLPISRALAGVKGAAANSDPVFIGGPVDTGMVFALARAPQKLQGATAVFGDIYFIESKTALEKELSAASNPGSLRVYAGYCGWGPQQLDNEVREGRWYIFNGSEELAFDGKPATLWLRLIDKADLTNLQKFTLLARPSDSLPARRIHTLERSRDSGGYK